MKKILIATRNPHKQKKLAEIVSNYFVPEIRNDLEEAGEYGDNFLEIAENKAKNYSKKYNCLTISTDGGAVIPSLSEWEPSKTKRFARTDQERIEKLLKMMEGKTDRTVKWYEAIAIAENGKIIFSAQARAMDGVIDKQFNPKFYRPGIWLCSITSFPQFNNKNFFELNEKEVEAVEDSWSKLKEKFEKFITKSRLS